MKSPVTRTQHPVYSFLLVAAFFQAMGGLMGWITASGIDGWYQSLEKSPFNPPDATFGIVWTVLYFLLSVAFWKLWRSGDSPLRSHLLPVFVVHMLLNWAWSPVFFTLHTVLPAVIIIVLLILSAIYIGWRLRCIDRRAALVFIPYTAWLGFACYLSSYILVHN